MLLNIGLLFSFTDNNQVQAVYGSGNKYTTSKTIRGTWKSSDKKSVYSKVKITAHTITFTPKATIDDSYVGAKGKWTLYNQTKQWKKLRNSGAHNMKRVRYFNKVQKYALKHHMLYAEKSNIPAFHNGTYIYFNWVYYYENSASGTFYRKGSKLIFDSIVHSSSFKKV